MLNFAKYVEMAQMRDEERIWFDEHDKQYLSYFPQEYWSKALQYRYSPNVLASPEQSVRDIALWNPQGSKQEIFKNVPVFGRQLLEKLKKGNYDPTKINLDRSTAKVAIKKLISGQKASLSLFGAKVGYEGAAADPKPNKTRHERSSSASTLEFTKDDQRFLNYFRRNPMLTPYMRTALERRYSPEFANSGKDYVDMEFSQSGGGRPPVIAKKVPMFSSRLKAELDNLKNNGIDFYANPLQKAAALRWIQSGKYNPGYNVGYRYAPTNA